MSLDSSGILYDFYIYIKLSFHFVDFPVSSRQRLGNVYIADNSNKRVRKVTVTSGIITTIAGSGSASLNGDDGGPATSAGLNDPRGVAVDTSGTMVASVYLLNDLADPVCMRCIYHRQLIHLREW